MIYRVSRERYKDEEGGDIYKISKKKRVVEVRRVKGKLNKK